MHRPQGLRIILSLGSAIAQLAPLVLMAVPAQAAPSERPARKFARHTHMPSGRSASAYEMRRARPRGAASTLKKTERLLAKRKEESQ